jgi:potassium/hydrogen antiporter
VSPVGQFLVEIAVLLLLGALGEFIFEKTGIPDVIWLVLAGVLAGPVLQIVSPAVLKPGIPFIGAISLVVILSGGALQLKFADVASAAPRALLLALVGFVFSVLAVVFFFFCATRLGVVKPSGVLGWILCGAIVGGASSLVITPTLSGGGVDYRVAHVLEVESAGTDALCIVVTMVIIEFMTSNAVDLSRPFLALGREIGLGAGFGVIAGAAFLPIMPRLHGRHHNYTLFLAMMLVLYSLTDYANGNGAVAVLGCGMVVGNANSIMKYFGRRAREYEWARDANAEAIGRNMTFIIKSFFFTLIGLMFPLSPRPIALGAVAAVLLLLFRIPAVRLSLNGTGLNPEQLRMVDIAMPRGIAAGVLSTLPVQYGVPGAENLSPGVFSLIVFSIVLFTVGFAVVKRRNAPAALADGSRPLH